MVPTDEHIKEIVELLDCGMICFFYTPTGSIEHYPDPNDLYFKTELWQEIMDKIDSDRPNYLRLEKMDPQMGYRVMEDFANTLTDTNFQIKLLELLSEQKPFKKFKLAVENSNYRQNWFDFKQDANINWVREQLG